MNTPPPPDEGASAPEPFPGQADAADLAQLYRALLGREAEPEVIRWAEPRPMHAQVAEMCASLELNRQVLHAIVHGRELPHERLGEDALAETWLWLQARWGIGLTLADAGTGTDDALPSPAGLLQQLYAHPTLATLLHDAHGSLFTQAVEDIARRARAGRLRLKGKIEFANREHISGWVVDASGTLANPLLEIRLGGADGPLVASATAHSYRPDVHRQHGGSGLAGYRAKWDPRQYPHGAPLEFTLHEASTGAQVGQPYRFENSFIDQLTVAQMLAHELQSIQQRLDTLAGMVPQALSYSAFPLEHYHYYRRAHRVPPPPWLVAWGEEGRLQRRRALALGREPAEPAPPPGPHFTILLDATAPGASATAVRISADSLRAQVGWPRWALQVIGTEGEIPEVASLLHASEPRIRHLPGWHEAGAHLQALATADTPAQPQWVLLLQAGELLDEHALAWCVQAQRDQPAVQALYWDEDRLRHRTGRTPARAPEHAEPILRTPFDPHSMLELNGVGTSYAVHAKALLAAAILLLPGAAQGQPVPAAGGSQPHPLAPTERELLVWALHHRAHGHPAALQHIPRFLLTRTEEVAAHPGDEHAHAPGAERLIATAAPERIRPLLPADWQPREWQRVPDPLAPNQAKPLVRWRPQRPSAVISVLIPTRDHGDLVKQCVDSMIALAERPERLDIVVADNGSTCPDTLAWLAGEVARQRIRVLRIDEPFNWSRLNNQLVAASRGEHLLFLNNDTRMLTRGWDAALRGELEHPATGAVGARLVYEDMTVQHAGVVFGYENFVGHAHVGQPTTGSGPLPLEPRTTRRCSAVTGAFMACRRAVFDHVGAFNETELSVTFNDVEWCVRVTEAGFDVVYAPVISMVHYESKSRGFDFLSLYKQMRANQERSWLCSAYKLNNSSDTSLSLSSHFVGALK